MSTLAEVMAELELAGTAQNRKVYARHGAAEPMFGVSYKELGRIAKPLRTDHALAAGLWDSGNHDARVLALRVADAAAVSKTRARRWLRDVDNYILAEALGGMLAQSPLARIGGLVHRGLHRRAGRRLDGQRIAKPRESDRRGDRRAAEPRAPRDERRAHRDRSA